MQYVGLGKCGLASSVIGLGGGSSGRFGLAKGGTRSDALKLIGRALDLGITFFDGAGVCGGVDELLRDGLAGWRERVLVSTKVHLGPDPIPFSSARNPNRASSWMARRTGFVCSASTLRKRVERTLRALRTDRIDVLHLHAVSPRQCPSALARAVPLLSKMKAEGKLRAIGVTEAYLRDSGHRMLREAVDHGSLDAVMVGFSLRNRSAADFVLPAASDAGIGVIGMFAVRGLGLDHDKELNDIIADAGATALPELAYRYCRHQRGMGIVLTGTGSPEHLARNVQAVLSGPLPPAVLRRLESWFDRQPQAEASRRK